MTEPLLQVEGLCAHFYTPAGLLKAVDEVSFTLERGEVLGLVGESGSGKSTIGYSIMGLVDPPGRLVGGRILLAGDDLCALPAKRLRALRGNRMAMIFADPMRALNPVLRIDAQMIETVRAHESISRAAAWGRAREALAKVGVPETRLKQYPHELSGGTRQRVAIATALLNAPELIIADEPTRGLDVTIQGQMVYELQQLAGESGTALIWITDDLSEIAGLCDRVGVMYAGRMVEQGRTEDVLRAPGHPYTRALIDSVPGSESSGDKLRQMAGTAPSRIDLSPGCAFRPRCPYATSECAQFPEMRPHGAAGQSLRCFHPLPFPE